MTDHTLTINDIYINNASYPGSLHVKLNLKNSGSEGIDFLNRVCLTLVPSRRSCLGEGKVQIPTKMSKVFFEGQEIELTSVYTYEENILPALFPNVYKLPYDINNILQIIFDCGTRKQLSFNRGETKKVELIVRLKDRESFDKLKKTYLIPDFGESIHKNSKLQRYSSLEFGNKDGYKSLFLSTMHDRPVMIKEVTNKNDYSFPLYYDNKQENKTNYKFIPELPQRKEVKTIEKTPDTVKKYKNTTKQLVKTISEKTVSENTSWVAITIGIIILLIILFLVFSFGRRKSRY